MLDPTHLGFVEATASAMWQARGDGGFDPGAMLRSAQGAHDGDCTGKPYGCEACTCIMALEEARAVIEAQVRFSIEDVDK